MAKRLSKPSKRAAALCIIRVAGYHGDRRLFTLTYLENRISLKVAHEQYAIGAQQRKNGMQCDCSECRKSHEPTQA